MFQRISLTFFLNELKIYCFIPFSTTINHTATVWNAIKRHFTVLPVEMGFQFQNNFNERKASILRI